MKNTFGFVQYDLAEKEKKDIKKEKPKSPHDMVLPPKIRGSKPDEKVPKQPESNEKRLTAKEKQSAKTEGNVLSQHLYTYE